MTKNKWLNSWIARPMTTAHTLLALVLGTAYAAGLYLPNDTLAAAAYCGIFLLILEYIVHKNLNAAYHFLDNATEASTLPVQQIKGVSLAMTAFHTGVTAIAMFLVPRLGLDRFLLWLRDSAIWLIRFLVSLLSRKKAPAAPLQQTQASVPDKPLLPFETSAVPGWLSFLFSILEFFCKILVAALLIGALCYGIQRLYKRFIGRQRYEGELREFISPDAHKQRLRAFHRPSGHALRKDFSPNAGIRKLYIKTLSRAKPKHVVYSSSDTPAQLEQKAFDKQLDPLHHYYEKARYSQEGCSKADLKEARKSI